MHMIGHNDKFIQFYKREMHWYFPLALFGNFTDIREYHFALFNPSKRAFAVFKANGYKIESVL